MGIGSGGNEGQGFGGDVGDSNGPGDSGQGGGGWGTGTGTQGDFDGINSEVAAAENASKSNSTQADFDGINAEVEAGHKASIANDKAAMDDYQKSVPAKVVSTVMDFLFSTITPTVISVPAQLGTRGITGKSIGTNFSNGMFGPASTAGAYTASEKGAYGTNKGTDNIGMGEPGILNTNTALVDTPTVATPTVDTPTVNPAQFNARAITSYKGKSYD